jgi:hypothetical protein
MGGIYLCSARRSQRFCKRWFCVHDRVLRYTSGPRARILPPVSALASLTALLLAVLPVHVEGDVCPSGAEVEQALASMIPMAPQPAGNNMARVERKGGKLRIVLIDAQSRVIAERVLDERGSCAELAKLAAIVIASWASDVHPEFLHPHAEPPAPPPAESPARGGAYDILLGASLSQSDQLAVGGSLGAAWFPYGAGLGLGLHVAGETRRTLDLGDGQAHWRRWVGSAEIAWRWARADLTVDPHAGLSLAWLTTSGAGFYQDQSSAVYSLAVTMGIRSAWWFSRRIAVWIDARSLYFTQGDVVYSTPPVRESALPRWQGIASIGLALGRAPDSR